jgi:hypothetical protein
MSSFQWLTRKPAARPRTAYPYCRLAGPVAAAIPGHRFGACDLAVLHTRIDVVCEQQHVSNEKIDGDKGHGSSWNPFRWSELAGVQKSWEVILRWKNAGDPGSRLARARGAMDRARGAWRACRTQRVPWPRARRRSAYRREDQHEAQQQAHDRDAHRDSGVVVGSYFDASRVEHGFSARLRRP